MAPSSHVEKSDIERATRILEKRDYQIYIHPQTYARHNQSAGTESEKAAAFLDLWNTPHIQAIWCAGGGNRALHLLDHIDFKSLAQSPKLLIGFSDVSALLNALAQHGIPSIHGPVFKNSHKYKEWDHLLALLGGQIPDYPFEKCTILKPGHAEGRLIGGNVSIVQYLPAALKPNFWKGGILFLEDWNEELSRFDRVMLNMKRLGVFDDIKGIIFGDFANWQDSGRPYGFSFEDIVLEHTDGLDIPIITNAPFGHGNKLYSFPVGVKASLEAKDDNINFRLLETACASKNAGSR